MKEENKTSQDKEREKNEFAVLQIFNCHHGNIGGGFCRIPDVLNMIKHAIKYGTLQGATKEREKNDFPHNRLHLGVQPNRTFLYDALLRAKELSGNADRLAKITGDSGHRSGKTRPSPEAEKSLAIAELLKTAEILDFYKNSSIFSVYHADEMAAAEKFFNKAVMHCIALGINYEKTLFDCGYIGRQK